MHQQDFSESEWSMLMQAPMQAIIAIALADKTDPVSFLHETRAAIQILAKEQNRTDIDSDLANSLLESLAELDVHDSLQGEQLLLKKQFELLGYLQSFKNAAEGRKHALSYFEQVQTLLAQKVTLLQAQAFKQWLLSVCRQVAEAVKEGGLFGLGGERVSRDEANMIAEIEKMLAV